MAGFDDPLQFAEEESTGPTMMGNTLMDEPADHMAGGGIGTNPFGDMYEEPVPAPPAAAPAANAAGGAADGGADTAGTGGMNSSMMSTGAAMTESTIFMAPTTSAAPLSGAAASTSYHPDAHTTCTVSQPQKMFRATPLPGIQEPFMSFLIQTRTCMPSYGGTSFSTRRRFSDFVDLANLLRKTHRGYFIPPCPDKAPLAGKMRTDPVFIEKRRRALQDYLNKLATHDVIGSSEELRMFLTIEGDLQGNVHWAQRHPVQQSWLEGAAKLLKTVTGQERGVLTPSDAAQPAARAADVLWTIKETRQRIAEGGAPPGLPGDERMLRDQRSVMEEFGAELAAATRGLDRAGVACAAVGEEQAAAGLQMLTWSRFEKDAGMLSSMAAAAQQVGNAMLRASKLNASATEACDTHMEGLHAYKDYIPAVLEALSEREGALLTVHTLESELERRRMRIAELQAGSGNLPDAATQKKLTALQHDVAGLEAALQAAVAEYDRITSHNKEELVKLKGEAWTELNETLIKYSEVQRSCNQEATSIWYDLAKQLGADQYQLHQIMND